MLNQVTIMGRITNDLELMTTNNGGQVLKFTTAVTRDFKNANGEYESDFIRCIAFNKSAEHIAKFGKKGKLITISGSLQTGSYENQQGQKVFTTDVIVAKCDVFTGNPKEQANDYTQAPQQGQVTDDDLPF